MNFVLVLHTIGILAMLAYGLTSFFAPQTVAKAISQTLNGARGQAEFRIGNGGFFAAMATWVLLNPSDVAFHILGMAWLGGAIARIIAYYLDKPKLDLNYLSLLLLESSMGLFLLI